ncbi:MAG: serpin family protein [Bacteroidales bacterium]|nr:serpin family protein [Bacteroidales bacterium]
MKKLFILSIISFLLTLSCNKDPNPQPQEINLKEGSEEVIESMNKFGSDLFQLILQNEPANKNIFISPTSISLALAMTLNGANTSTEDSMVYALRMEGLESDQINETYRDLIEALQTCDEKVLLEIANSIWYREGFPAEQDFLDINSTYYDAEVTELDFLSPNAVPTINHWVADKTHDKIPEIIDMIEGNCVMFLINAIYFKGDWSIEFDKKNTAEADFKLADGSTKKVAMMNFTEEVVYMETSLFQACELDYGRGNYSMMIMLPAEGVSLDSLMNLSVMDMAPPSSLSLDMYKTETTLYLPKFKFDYEIRLNDILSDMGMEIAFASGTADFSGINPSADLYIDYVKHKSFVDVNEEGTEAAAATVVAINERAVKSNVMNVNRPFFFVIREKETNTAVFMGRVADPEYEE